VVQRPVQMTSTSPLGLINIAETECLTKREVPNASLSKNRSSENLIELKTNSPSQKDITEEIKIYKTPHQSPGHSPIKTDRQMDKASSKYEKTHTTHTHKSS